MLRQKTFIVTGGNQGLGLECVHALAKVPGATIVIACRDEKKGTQAAQALTQAGVDIRVMQLDLASLASVRQFCNAFATLKLPPLMGVVNNAGLQEIQSPSTTVDGFETTFGVNHLGHFLLTQLLLEWIARDGRIVFVSSSTHDPEKMSGIAGPRYTTANDVAHDMEPGMKAGQRRYSTSKLCNVFNTYELAKHLAASDDERLRSIHVNAFDPGLMPGTGLARQHPAALQFLWNYVLPVLRWFVPNVHSAKTSGKRLADLVSDPRVTATGKYFSDGSEIPSSSLSYDTGKATELWQSSLQMVGLSVP